ncbi:hypothetical protein COUCH_23055 [Couchioplanes caeruleus]|uniref:hypothetical protein n=1 Tax=Couchioplanes caeruleus TaxID=56438 RepID=UPI0020C0F9C7|nr:hypothetical protein [Couchioplanes caeruleus]UQU61918.1 hypothetical protein COUCH_23055 [Couchioplanes caeruleus]
MTDFRDAGAPAATRVVCPDSLGLVLLTAAARAVRGRDCRGLDRVPTLGQRWSARDGLTPRTLVHDAAGALPVALVARLDADAVASWIEAHYPEATYPAVVLGSPHGAAVHLAAALGAPWLPSGFTVTVPWPGGSPGDWEGAMDWGGVVADAIVAANPDVTVRQVHDPLLRGPLRGPLCGTTITLHLRWRTLPPAYRSFLACRLRPGGAALMVRDIRTWPTLDLAPGHSFQLGSPASGWSPDGYTMANPLFRRALAGLDEGSWSTPYLVAPRRCADQGGEVGFDHDLRRHAAPVHRLLYARSPALSVFVAELYRRSLGERGGGRDCAVTSGTLVDPGRVLAAGLVPYWCESASRQAADAAEWWLAGAAGFEGVTVVPQPPGLRCEAHADARQWRSVAAFARERPVVDPVALARYPLFPLPTSHATSALAGDTAGADVAGPLRLTAGEVLAALHDTGPALGPLVS